MESKQSINIKDKIAKVFGKHCLDALEHHIDPNIMLPDEKILLNALLLKTIFSNKVRTMILFLLAQQPLPVCVLAAILDKDQTLISHNLSMLKNVGLVHEQKIGKFRFYSLKKEKLIKMLEDIIGFLESNK